MGQKKEIKLEDIAAKTGVSIVTVSNALKGKKGVSEKLRRRIQDTARELGYQTASTECKNGKHSYPIGVIVAERYVKEFPSFYMDIYKRVAQEASRKGHLTILEVVDEKKERLEQASAVFSETEIAGIILIGELNAAYIQELRGQCAVPVVCVDYYDVYEDMDFIVTDGYGGMEQMTELLLENGHEDLMFVGTLNGTKNITDRYLGYCKALEKRGMEGPQKQILYDRDLNYYHYKLDICLPEKLPDAFVCNCDKTANILLEKLKEAGASVPEDVSIVSFDHFHSSTRGGIEFTTYENDEKVIAHISVNTLLRRIEGKTKPAGVRIIQGRVVEGNTVKRKKGRKS